MAIVTPEQLEAEAKELIDQLTNASAEPVAADTQEEPEEVVEETPEEPEESVEVPAEEVSEEESDSGEDSPDLAAIDDRVEKAERAMKGAQRKMTQATQEAADLRKERESLMKLVTELKGQLAESARDTERLSKLKEEYPDVAAPLLDEIQILRDRLDEHSVLNEKRDEQLQQVEQQKQLEAHFDAIRAVHPDFEDVTNTSDWALWLEDQNALTQHWVQYGSSNDVNAVISKFKVDMGVKPATPQERTLERAKAVAEPKMPKARKSNVVGEKKTWTVDEIKRMPNEVFEKHQKEILQSYKDGTIRR